MEFMKIKDLYEICKKEINLGHENYDIELGTGGHYDGLAEKGYFIDNDGEVITLYTPS